MRHRELMPLLLEMVPEHLRARFGSVSIQQVVASVRETGRHPWIHEFETKYGLLHWGNKQGPYRGAQQVLAVAGVRAGQAPVIQDQENRVVYREESFLIERSGQPVARLEPVGPRRGVTLQEVIERIGDLQVPEGFAEAVEEFRAAQGNLEEPDWLS